MSQSELGEDLKLNVKMPFTFANVRSISTTLDSIVIEDSTNNV